MMQAIEGYFRDKIYDTDPKTNMVAQQLMGFRSVEMAHGMARFFFSLFEKDGDTIKDWELFAADGAKGRAVT